MAADPDDFIPDNDCVDGDCNMTNYFAIVAAFKPAQMATSILMKSAQPATSVAS